MKNIQCTGAHVEKICKNVYHILLHNIRRQCRFWSRLLSSHTKTTAACSWLVCLHVPSNLCRPHTMQQPSWSSAYPSSPTPHCYCTRCTGYWQLLEFTSPTVLSGGSDPPYIWDTAKPYTSACPLHSFCQSACYSLTTRLAQLPFNKVMTVCCPGSTMVEPTPHWHQVSRNSAHLQMENSSVQTAPGSISKWNLFIVFKCNTWSSSEYLMKLMNLHDSCNFGVVST